jgi:hypothetical protein
VCASPWWVGNEFVVQDCNVLQYLEARLISSTTSGNCTDVWQEFVCGQVDAMNSIEECPLEFDNDFASRCSDLLPCLDEATQTYFQMNEICSNPDLNIWWWYLDYQAETEIKPNNTERAFGPRYTIIPPMNGAVSPVNNSWMVASTFCLFVSLLLICL